MAWQNLDSVFKGTRGEIFQNDNRITDFTERIELDELTIYSPKPSKKIEVVIWGVTIENNEILELLGTRDATYTIISNGLREAGSRREEKCATVKDVRFKKVPTHAYGKVDLVGEGSLVEYS